MRLQSLVALLAVSLLAGACGDRAPALSAPTVPSASSSPAITGTWIGAASDSSGSMMGAGMSFSSMSNMTWQVTQTGNTFTGTMQFPGYAGMGMGRMTVSGTVNGATATFTMTLESGSMMTGTCSASATGTFDMDDLIDEMHGSYAGSNTCTGSFDQGQVLMTRR